MSIGTFAKLSRIGFETRKIFNGGITTRGKNIKFQGQIDYRKSDFIFY